MGGREGLVAPRPSYVRSEASVPQAREREIKLSDKKLLPSRLVAVRDCIGDLRWESARRSREEIGS